ncbi:MAG: glycosyl hydrolase family 28 protein [Cytophagales bacterium]|nr:glycosyl hydrolase family 28 protein [Cytophagales bacterium]
MKFSLTFILLFPMLYACTSPPPSQEPDITKTALDRAEAIVASIALPKIPSTRIDLVKFSGKAPDEEGTHDFREDIEKAIAALVAQGGGTLFFPHTRGKNAWVKQVETYRVKGPIHLKSNIRLAFDPNLRLYFEFDPASYMLPGGTLRRYEGTTMFSFSPLIYAFNEKNIAIVQEKGAGVPAKIDGDGMRWQRWAVEQDGKRRSQGLKPSYEAIRDVNHRDTPLKDRIFTDVNTDVFRPQLISFFMCENILMDGVQVENSPFWMVHPVFSKNMVFRNLIFDGPVVNNDGFDPESSSHVLIENIIFNNHDDNVAIKAGRDKEGRDGVQVAGTLLQDIDNEYIKDGRLGGPTTHVVVRNCTFRGHHAVAIGSEMSGGAHTVFIYDNVGPQQVKNALYLKSSRKRGGTIQDIYMFNNRLNYVESVVALLPNYDGDKESPFIPTFKNVWVVNTQVNTSNHGIRIKGWPAKPIAGVTLTHVSIDSVRKEEHLSIQNVKDLTLDRVVIEGKAYDQVINQVDSTALPGKSM